MSNTQASVLVVEDEVLVRTDLSLHLREAGFPVFEAGSAAEAIEILDRNGSIRIVFTDRMPGEMDGCGLARVVRERWPPTMIVMCSGNADEAVAMADIFFPRLGLPVGRR